MKNDKFKFSYVNFGLIALGVIFRIYVYFQNRSFTIDEANLADNIIKKSGLDFFKSLDHLQYAPPLFLHIQKFMTSIFGVNEFSLRLFPLISGIAGCLLFYLLCKNWLKEKFIIFPMALFAFSGLFIRYCTENKSYSSDLFVALFLIYAALKIPLKNNWKSQFTWLIIGTLSIWLSMPSIFILFGIGIYFIHLAYKDGQYHFILANMLITLFWAINFIFYYVGILSKDIWVGDLQTYHMDYFLDWSNPKKLIRAFQIFLDTMIGHTGIAIAFRAIVIPTGLYFLWKKSRWDFALLLSPILLCLLFASFNMYSLIPRLIIFLIPLVLIIIAIGFEKLMELSPKPLQYILIAMACIIVVNHTAHKYLKEKLEPDVIKPSIEYLKSTVSPEDQVYLFHKAVPAYKFYSELHDQKNKFAFDNFQLGDWNNKPQDIVKSKSGKTYVIGLHLETSDLDYLKGLFGELREFKKIRSESIFVAN